MEYRLSFTTWQGEKYVQEFVADSDSEAAEMYGEFKKNTLIP